MATHLSIRKTQFFYFDQLLAGPVWKGSKILDFGGNVGGFLVSAGTHVVHDDYWCLDVTQAAIEQGHRNFPQAHFVHYNRYSSYFNPDGIRNLPVPDLGLKFDIIMAFSVFTHTHQKEMLELVERLRSMLVPQGIFAFTFRDPRFEWTVSDPGLSSRNGVREMFECQVAESSCLGIEGTVETERPPNWCVEVDDELYIEPSDELCQQMLRGKHGESYCSYFNVEYMVSLFPDAIVLPPVSPESQHCCILRNELT